MRILFKLIVLLSGAATAWAVAAPESGDTGNLHFKQCQVTKGAVAIDAECGVLTRPENPDDPNGATVDIHIAKFPARSLEPAADALTIIQGGPGMSSIDLYLRMQPILRSIQAKRDILVIDQRGTGRSNMLTCPQANEYNYAQFDPQLIRRYARECLAELKSDPRYYTTSIAVQDLDAVRRAAGYQQLSIYGVSYGTRVAQHYLRRFPANTRAVILDAVADLGVNLAGGEIARRSQQAFDRLVERCNADKACSQKFGNLGLTFEQLRTQLSAEPVEVDFPHPLSGQPASETITLQHLLGLVRMMPYATESLALLPVVLQRASQGDFVALAALSVLQQTEFERDYALAMNNAVVCTEDAPYLTQQDLQDQQETYFGASMAEGLQALCEIWPTGIIDEDFRESFDSEVPVLLLSGENDPITPPENAERTSAMFSNARHIVVPAHGHGVIGRGCVPQLATEFIESANPQELLAECVQREKAMPIFTSPAGPTP